MIYDMYVQVCTRVYTWMCIPYLLFMIRPVNIILFRSNNASLFRMLEHLASQYLTKYQQSKRSSQETPPDYYSGHCKPFNVRHSTERSIQRMKNQALNTWPDNAELIAG